jgi:PAS domain S-box-containing protein
MSIPLCASAQLIASTLSESSEACFLLNAEGTVLYENPAAKRLIFETTENQFDTDAGDPKHSYHFSFFFSFASTTTTTTTTTAKKPWQDYFDDLIENNTESNASTPTHKRFDVSDDGIHECYDVTCKKSNGTEFPARLRLSKIGKCPCCEDSVYLCAYVRAKLDVNNNNPFAMERNTLRCILNAAFDPVFSIDETGIILFANLAAEKVFGYSHGELVGTNISRICGGDHAAKHDEYIRNYLNTGVKKIIGQQREVAAKRKDGTEFLVELGIKEVNCADYGLEGRVIFCAFMKDLSMEKLHEVELKHKVDLMQGMINASFDPLFQIDERGIIRNVNNAAMALFGYQRDEMIDQNISIICSAEHAGKHDSYLKHYLETGEKHVIGRKRKVTARRKNGQEFDIELGVQEVVSPNGERIFCGYVRDLTKEQLDKRRMRNTEATMKSRFFGEE